MCRTARSVVVAVILTLLAPSSRAASPEDVDAALARAKEFIYKQQKDDHFEQKMNEPWVQTGGHTALAVYALLAAGESHQDPRIAKAIEYLKKVESKGIYAVGVRCLVWNALPQTDDVKAAMKKDLNYLLANVIKEGRGKGFYDYMGGGKSYSHSRAQYAVLGVWAAAQSGLEVPRSYWDLVEKAWIADQQPDGGWGYQSPKDDKHGITPGMTAVGVATLFITEDYLHPNEGIGCRGNTRNIPIEKGMKYMIDHFDKIGTSERYHAYDFPYATLYAVERIGVASGQKYFGTNDWYQKGADWLLKVQTKSGANKGMWFAPKTLCTPLHDTCFGVLFLARGRAAVAVNKLEYAGAEGKPANWNQRPRDIANLVRWVGKAAERDLQWQIVNLQVPAIELHDAPILYIAGNQELALPDEQKQKLKRYVEGGGLLLANADCGDLKDAKFAASFRKLVTELFPGYEFRELPESHPIYTEQQFLRANWKNKPSVLGLSNGARELALVLPQADPGKAWQLQLVGGKEEFWQLGADIFQYAIDKRNIGFKGQTHIVTRDEKVKAEKTIKVGRVEYGGNWNPEPGGWRRLADWMHNKEKTDLDVVPVKLTKDKLDGVKVIHLTGTTPLVLDAASQVELRNFAGAGGTIVIDAAGGSAEFAQSVENLIPLLFPGQKPQPLPPEHAVFKTGATKLGEIEYRTFARKSLTGGAKGSKLQGIEKDGRVVLFYSREDLSAGLVGQPVDGIIGYDPRTATELMSKIILYAGK
ncbi:MAG: DUF4159 domain-containing protein [Tepidisphaeraceae bacterium]